MQIISKVVIYAVLACLLLSWVGDAQRSRRHVDGHHRGRHEYHRVLAHLRRCRGGNPIHHPVRPSKNAVLPPDDEEVDTARLLPKGSQQWLLATDPESDPRSLSGELRSRPLPTQVPRHQTLCLLLI